MHQHIRLFAGKERLRSAVCSVFGTQGGGGAMLPTWHRAAVRPLLLATRGLRPDGFCAKMRSPSVAPCRGGVVGRECLGLRRSGCGGS